ncbi:hypothetical protein M514_27097 [Trichuris suis]|uniref:Uncharacterized protein n=1 Tax=Trichuris suis TaxID=68888 RepID=A0A085LV44_9BILA|nr:hypothetical protein M513_10203 [Trichuris suis]KFD49049.1 hypothetical protein M513_10097 [Trichuris suis]KFD60741.1 hypothetical protein M514_27097 [Trichuris suis]
MDILPWITPLEDLFVEDLFVVGLLIVNILVEKVLYWTVCPGSGWRCRSVHVEERFRLTHGVR